jgi:hypothetical protein
MSVPSRNAVFGLLALGVFVLGAAPRAVAQYEISLISDIAERLSPPLPPTVLVLSVPCISDNDVFGAQAVDLPSHTFESLLIHGTRWISFMPFGINGINASGATVGFDLISCNGWSRTAGGVVTFLTAPGAFSTSPQGISNNGAIVGFFFDAQENEHGFILDHSGYHQVDYPGAAGTQLNGINSKGTAVGTYFDAAGNDHAFSLDKHGRFMALAIPGAVTSSGSGINEKGQMVGGYFTAANEGFGFIYHRGAVTTIDASEVLPPDVNLDGDHFVLAPGSADTSISGINARGDIVGPVEAFYTNKMGNILIFSDGFMGSPH